MRTKQIFISGASGSGKTTLAKHISAVYNIPFISCSTKNLWEHHGIKNHQEIIIRSAQDPLWGLSFQLELLEYRKEVLKGNWEFVTDRSPLDNILYFMLQNAPHLHEIHTHKYIEKCKEMFHMYDATQIYLEPAPELENDGMRINNPYYQEITHAIMKYIIEENWVGSSKKVLVIKDWDWRSRVKTIEHLFGEEVSIWDEIRRKLGL